MSRYTKTLEKELNECGRASVFEIEVFDQHGDTSWIHCDVFFEGNSLVAHRDAVSTQEARGNKIAANRLVVDDCLSLDEHLQSLHEDITETIGRGDLFDVAN